MGLVEVEVDLTTSGGRLISRLMTGEIWALLPSRDGLIQVMMELCVALRHVHISI